MCGGGLECKFEKWLPRRNGYPDEMVTQTKWLHRRNGYPDEMVTQTKWLHRRNGYTDEMVTHSENHEVLSLEEGATEHCIVCFVCERFLRS